MNEFLSTIFTNIEPIPFIYLIGFIILNIGMIFAIDILLKLLDKKSLKAITNEESYFSAAIGFVERILYFIAFVNYDIQFLGLLLVLKTIIRFPEVKEKQSTHFAEKYIFGTMLNLLFAYFAAYILNSF